MPLLLLLLLHRLSPQPLVSPSLLPPLPRAPPTLLLLSLLVVGAPFFGLPPPRLWKRRRRACRKLGSSEHTPFTRNQSKTYGKGGDSRRVDQGLLRTGQVWKAV